LAVPLFVAACEEAPAPNIAAGGSLSGAATAEQTAANRNLAYRHHAAMETEPAGVNPRFERSRAWCQAQPLGACQITASAVNGGGGKQLPFASLTMRLSRGTVEQALAFALDRQVAGQRGRPILVWRNTAAKDLSAPV
jgi:hypothetical protein